MTDFEFWKDHLHITEIREAAKHLDAYILGWGFVSSNVILSNIEIQRGRIRTFTVVCGKVKLDNNKMLHRGQTYGYREHTYGLAYPKYKYKNHLGYEGHCINTSIAFVIHEFETNRRELQCIPLEPADG